MTSFAQKVTAEQAAVSQFRQELLHSFAFGYEPIVFVGEIDRLDPIPQFWRLRPPPQNVDFTVSQVLWGFYKAPRIQAGYYPYLPTPPFAVHEKVIVYCNDTWNHRARGICSTPILFSERLLQQVNQWIADAKTERRKRIVATIRTRLAKREWLPDQFRGRLAKLLPLTVGGRMPPRPALYRGIIASVSAPRPDSCHYQSAKLIDTDARPISREVEIMFQDCSMDGTPRPGLEAGRKIISFCLESNSGTCAAQEALLGIIADSDETYRALRKLVGPPWPPTTPLADWHKCPFEGCKAVMWTATKDTPGYRSWISAEKKYLIFEKGHPVKVGESALITIRPDRVKILRPVAGLPVKPGEIVLLYGQNDGGHWDLHFSDEWVRNLPLRIHEPDGSGCARDCDAQLIEPGEKQWWATVYNGAAFLWVRVQDNFDGTGAEREPKPGCSRIQFLRPYVLFSCPL